MSNADTAVIVCGGKGSRLGALTEQKPKALVDIHGEPQLLGQIRRLIDANIRTIHICAGHLGDQIEQVIASVSGGTTDILVHLEPTPAGTAGAVRRILTKLPDRFLIIYGDIYWTGDVVSEMLRASTAPNSATLAVKPSEHPETADIVHLEDDSVIRIDKRGTPTLAPVRNWTPAALLLSSKRLFELGLLRDFADDIVSDLVPAAIAAGEAIQAWKVPEHAWVKDMGTPEGLIAVRRRAAWEWTAAAARRIGGRGKLSWMLLDRDGVIVEDQQAGTQRTLHLIVRDDAVEAIRWLNLRGVRVAVVTNQGAIARGDVTVDDVEAQHRDLCKHLALLGAHVEAFFYCPHHPETHHANGIRSLRRACQCRKPQPGLIHDAAQQLGFDLGRAALVGDQESDVAAGRNAGLATGRFFAHGPCSGSRADVMGDSVLTIVQRLVLGRENGRSND